MHVKNCCDAWGTAADLVIPKHNPTNPFTILEPHDQEIDEFYLVQERRVTNFEAPKLGKSSSGTPTEHFEV